MEKPNIFKIVSITLSVIIGIVAILIFSGKFPGIDNNTANNNANKPTLQVWGSLPRVSVEKAMQLVGQNTGKPFQFNYMEYPENMLADKLIQASASGMSPDLVLASDKVVNSVAGLLYVIPYTYMDELIYKNTFIDASHIYTTPYGAQGYPVIADPLITFYNKKIFRENSITNPPYDWVELPKYQGKLTQIGASELPLQSAFGLGANNVLNSRDILVASLMQLGHNPAKLYYSLDIDNTLTQNFANDIGVVPTAGEVEGDLSKILRYQTAFSDSQKTVYTWSERDMNDYKKFVSGSSGIYFGKASDHLKILAESPNLELGMYFIPQLSSKFNVTTGDLFVVGVSRSTKDFGYAVEMAQQMSGIDYSSALASALGVSSARKDTLAGNDGSERSAVIGGSALIMQIFYDLNSKVTDSLIYRLYEDILSGRKSIEKAVEVFEKDFLSIYKQNY